MKESGDDDTYYLKGPSEFAAPVEKEVDYWAKKWLSCYEENTRLRSLIQEAFEYGWFRSKDNLYSVIWEQFKKDNNL